MKEVEIIHLSADRYANFTWEPIGSFWVPFGALLIRIGTQIRILSRVKLLCHQSDFKTLTSLLGFQNLGLFILELPYKQKMILFFNGGWNFHRSESQTKFKRIFVRDQGFNKNTSYSYNPRNYKRPPLVIWIPIFKFRFFLISFNQFNGFFPRRIIFRLNLIESSQGVPSLTHASTPFPCCFDYPFVKI